MIRRLKRTFKTFCDLLGLVEKFGDLYLPIANSNSQCCLWSKTFPNPVSHLPHCGGSEIPSPVCAWRIGESCRTSSAWLARGGRGYKGRPDGGLWVVWWTSGINLINPWVYVYAMFLLLWPHVSMCLQLHDDLFRTHVLHWSRPTTKAKGVHPKTFEST